MGALHSCLKPGGHDESPIVSMMERAIETGNLEKYPALSQIPYVADVRERFHHIMDREITMIEIILLLVVNMFHLSLTS